MSNWKTWVTLFVIFIVARQCGKDDGSDNSGVQTETYSSASEPAPAWIQGEWICRTPYGTFMVEIDGNHIKEFDGESHHEGTYHIQDDMIMTNTGSRLYYQIDFANKRLSAGHGYYFTKK